MFIYVGRVAVEKNIGAFLDLDLPGSKVVVGGGPQLAALRREYPSVTFTGPRYGEALARAYAGADVFVFPSLTDTFGLVILESLACGTPVAAFPVTGPKDVLTGAMGCVGAINTDLRQAALDALQGDREACRAHAERYSWRACAETVPVASDADARGVLSVRARLTSRLTPRPCPLIARRRRSEETMAAKSKVVGSFREAVADIPDGSTIAFGGFAMPGTPFNLIKALLEQGAKRLTLVGNTTGGAQQPRMPDMGMLVENGQVAKVICAFTAATRPTDTLPFTKYYESGECDAELVPQGTLAERMRAAGAGIPAFYTPTAVGTELADGPRDAR